MIRFVTTTMRKRIIEILCFSLLMCLGVHFIAERIEHATMPSGDEGSWLAAAAQESRGEGFSTRWLEYQFQKPYRLPRPDDFRYPGLVLLLALVFKIAGISYFTALTTCAAVFICFCAAVFLCVRKFFGRASALLTLAAVIFSLNQLQWNTIVYCEGLFGLVLALLLIFSITADPRTKRWWIMLGAGIGLLAMVRPNGIVLSAGLVGQYLRMRRSAPVPARYLGLSLLCAASVMAPWFVRNTLCFGNPFHIAGGAGLLQRSFNEPVNESVFAFIKTAGILFPLKATIAGIPRFFVTLIAFEHGLCVPLFVFCGVGFILRMRFFNAFAAAGFALSFLLCCYAAYKSYAGVRYFSPFLPFVYAFGIHTAVSLIRRIRFVGLSQAAAYAGFLCVGLAFLAPVWYPHRYYERYFHGRAESTFDYSAHVNALKALLNGQTTYLAGRLGQLNFLTRYNCVGVQEDFDSAQVHRALTAFKPAVLALAPEETAAGRFAAFIDLLQRNNCAVTCAASNSFGVYYRLSYPHGPY